MLKTLDLKCAFAICAAVSSLDYSCCANVVKLNGRLFSRITNSTEAKNFADALYEAKYDDIEIESKIGMVTSHSRLNDAINVIINNSFLEASTNEKLKQLYMVFLWSIYKSVFPSNLETQGFCYEKMNEIAKTSFEKAELLLLSQCKTGKVVPLESADWSIIGDAVYMLADEKNGYRERAFELLKELKATGKYPMLRE